MNHPAKGKKRPELNKDGRPRKKTRAANQKLPNNHPHIERTSAAALLGCDVQTLDKMIGFEFTRIPFCKRGVRLLRAEVNAYREAKEETGRAEKMENQKAASAEARRQWVTR